MLIFHILISFFVWLMVLPLMWVSIPVIAILLLTSWDGKTTIFGNEKWGRANNHPINPTHNYWQEFLWLFWRNPLNNLFCKTLSLKKKRYKLRGDKIIGDKIKGGFYSVRMGLGWEYYWIKPYGNRCIRARIGWKIHNGDSPSPLIFAINPWKKYTGI